MMGWLYEFLICVHSANTAPPSQVHSSQRQRGVTAPDPPEPLLVDPGPVELATMLPPVPAELDAPPEPEPVESVESESLGAPLEPPSFIAPPTEVMASPVELVCAADSSPRVAPSSPRVAPSSPPSPPPPSPAAHVRVAEQLSNLFPHA